MSEEFTQRDYLAQTSTVKQPLEQLVKEMKDLLLEDSSRAKHTVELTIDGKGNGEAVAGDDCMTAHFSPKLVQLQSNTAVALPLNSGTFRQSKFKRVAGFNHQLTKSHKDDLSPE